jgi:hypothetical protein
MRSLRPAIIIAAVLLALPAFVNADYRLADVPAEEDFAVSTSTAEGTAFPGASFMKFDPSLWNESRDAVDAGRQPGAPAPGGSTTTAVSSGPAAGLPAAEPAGLINVDLPYESGLSIAGRKLISVKMQETRRKSAEKARQQGLPQQQRDFEMKQEMQVKIKGKVGRKIAVNVDFDDTKDDKKDISVVYTGDPGEVVQEAAFGDITLSLPFTEFVSYSKQVFGVRTKLKYKNAQIMAIGSRTKGVTETKRFNGNVVADRREILDTSYVKDRYYDIGFIPGRPIRSGTVRVWRDDLNPATNNPALTTAFSAQDFSVSTQVFSGAFDELREGIDYALDLSRGMVILNRDAGLNDALVVDYVFNDNGATLASVNGGLPKLIKTPGDRPLDVAADPSTSGEIGFRREVKTFYSIGQTKIVPNDGRGNFLLKTQDLNRVDNAVFLNNGQQLRYPTNVEVDFTNGRFNLAISSATGPILVDTTTHRLYDPSPEHKFSFIVEFKYKKLTYNIKPNLVFGSEHVIMNGRTLSRDVDYFVDYDSGYLTFFNEDQIDETTQIEVTYEFAPFGGQLGETLVGTREELDLVPGRFKVGSTFLYDFAPKPTIVPDIRSTPRSIMVLEADGRLQDWKIPFTPAVLGLQAEVAQSKNNPNLYGKALVDSMEGVKQEVEAILGPEAWRPAANANPGSDGVGRADSLWTNLGDEQLRLKDINPNITSERQNDKVRVMILPFSLQHKPGGTGPEVVSLVQSLSKSGLDFSKKVSMELWVEGAGAAAGAGVDMCVNVGQFNENTDGSGILKTEDRNLDGSLNFGEDVGWTFNSPGDNGVRNGDVNVGAGNGRLDSEDFDGDGSLRTADLTPRGNQSLFCLSNGGSAAAHANDSDVRMVNPVTSADDKHQDLAFDGWRLITVPLKISESEEPDFQAIKQVRLTFTNDAGAALHEGRIRLGRVSFVGTSWEKPIVFPDPTVSTMTLAAVNNVDNPGYAPLLGNPVYNDLYKDEATGRTREQALALTYELAPGSTATTRSLYTSTRDFSSHRSLQFFVQVPASQTPGGTLSLRIGGINQTEPDFDYYEYTIPLTNRYRGAWVLETLQLTDLNGDSIPDVITPLNPQATVRVVGSPSFQRIGQLKLVVSNPGPGQVNSQVWVNEIHLVGSRKKEGHAQRFAADVMWPNWGTLSGRVRQQDRNFETLTAQVLNQDKNDSGANFAFTRLRWLPLSGSVSKAETVTPAVFRTGEAGLVSLLSEGREVTASGRGDGQLLLPNLPAFGFSYDKALSVSTTRGERRDRDAYTGSADYQLPWAPDVVPGARFTFRPLPQSVFVKYTRTMSFFSVLATTGTTVTSSTNVFPGSTTTFSTRDLLFNRTRTTEMADEWSGRTPFSFWDGFSVQPTYSFKKVRERRKFSDEALAFAPDFNAARSYDKGLSQTVGFSGSWRLARWLEPRFDGELAGSETNVLPTASSVTAFNVKFLNRSAKGNLFWTFRAMDLVPNFRPTQSLRLDNSWQLQSGDAFENVDKDFNGWRRVRPFRAKKVNRKGGRPIYDLLEPMDADAGGGRRTQFTARNSLRSSLDWTPFDWLNLRGPVEPLRTFRMTATLTDTDEHVESGEAVRDVSTVVWPDLLLSIRDTERMFHLDRWMSNSQLNLRTNKKDTRTFGETFQRANSLGSDYHFLFRNNYDVFLSYGVTDGFTTDLRSGLLSLTSKGYGHSVQVGTKIRDWQVTPRADFRGDRSSDSAGRITQDTETQSYSVLMRLDKSYPRGFRIPFTRKVYENVNRLIVDWKFGFERRTSAIDVENNNTDAYSSDITGEWEISKHFRLSFGGGLSMLKNRVVAEDGVMTYQLNSQLVINF